MKTNMTLPCLSDRLCGLALNKALFKADCVALLPRSCIIYCSTDGPLKPPMRMASSDSRSFQRKKTKMMVQRIGGQLCGQLVCVEHALGKIVWFDLW